MQHPCSCTAECGCIGAPVVPSCDNSAVPKVSFVFLNLATSFQNYQLKIVYFKNI